MKAWLLSPVGYRALHDTYDPDFFRMGICKEAISFTPRRNKGASMQLPFHCQPQRWSVEGQNWSRKQALLELAKSAGKSIGDLQMQLDFLWQELQGYKAVLNTLKTAATVRAASDSVLTGFKRPADMSEAVQVKRSGFGQTYYDKYVSGKSSAADDKPTVSSFPAVPFFYVLGLRIELGDEVADYLSEQAGTGSIDRETANRIYWNLKNREISFDVLRGAGEIRGQGSKGAA